MEKTRKDIISEMSIKFNKDNRDRNIYNIASKTHFIYRNIKWIGSEMFEEYNISSFKSLENPMGSFKPENFRQFKKASEVLNWFIKDAERG